MKPPKRSPLLVGAALGLLALAPGAARADQGPPAAQPGGQAPQGAPAQVPQVEAPRGFDEGTEYRLSSAQVQELLPWAYQTERELKKLKSSALAIANAREQRDFLVAGIKAIVVHSEQKRTELLLRYVLNRAVRINEVIEQESDTRVAGVIDQQSRLVLRSIDLALRYFQNDIDFLRDIESGRKVDLAVLPFAEFGKEYAALLMSLNASILDSSAQYRIGVMALGLLQWDLFRDQAQKHYAPAILELKRVVDLLPDAPAATDRENVSRVRQIRKAYREFLELDTRPAPAPATPPVAQEPAPQPAPPRPRPETPAPTPRSGEKNADGSFVLIDPTMQWAGKTVLLDDYSDRDGVCKRFGYTAALPNTLRYETNSGGTANIKLDANGNFVSFDSDRDYIHMIYCLAGPRKIDRSLVRATVTANSDGSSWIATPEAKYSGQWARIDDYSDRDGVCRMLGFSTAVPNSLRYETSSSSAPNVKLDSSGFFVSYDSDRDYISGMACR